MSYLYDEENDPMIGVHFRQKSDGREIEIVGSFAGDGKEERPGYDYVFVDEMKEGVKPAKHWVTASGMAVRFESLGPKPAVESAFEEEPEIEQDGPRMGL